MNTFNTYSNPMKQVLLLSHFTNEKTGTGKRLSQEWQRGATAAEPTFSGDHGCRAHVLKPYVYTASLSSNSMFGKQHVVYTPKAEARADKTQLL